MKTKVASYHQEDEMMPQKMLWLLQGGHRKLQNCNVRPCHDCSSSWFKIIIKLTLSLVSLQTTRQPLDFSQEMSSTIF